MMGVVPKMAKAQLLTARYSDLLVILIVTHRCRHEKVYGTPKVETYLRRLPILLG